MNILFGSRRSQNFMKNLNFARNCDYSVSTEAIAPPAIQPVLQAL